MKSFISVVGMFLVLAGQVAPIAQATAESAYIDDKIKVWSRTGPSNAFKVKYRLTPGTKFEVLEKNEESGFVKVRDEAGRVSWLDSQYISAVPTANILLVDAKTKIERLQAEHMAKLSSLEKQVQALEPLRGINQKLQNEIAEINTDYEQLSQESQVYRGRFEQEAFFSGALVFIGGMFVGWILSKLGGGRKRNSGGWS